MYTSNISTSIGTYFEMKIIHISKSINICNTYIKNRMVIRKNCSKKRDLFTRIYIARAGPGW
jgi:hypothetical protein